jgi:methionine-S-sulfoxide reductase
MNDMKKIVFAGGCFWGIQAYFKKVKGVLKTEVGYIDGSTDNPTYQDVLRGSGHTEAMYLEYDENKTTLKLLMDHLFNIIDPTSINRQGNDIGINYRSGVYCYSEEDLSFVQSYIKEAASDYKKPIAVEVKMARDFYSAEDYHQDYLHKNPGGYCHINLNKIFEIQNEE